jgi:mono/diheme cytochrome c family protein
MTMRSRAATVMAVGALAAAGCGSDSGGGSSDTSKSPKDTFADTCGSCHTLKAAGTEGQTGPNLDELKPDKALVLKTIAEGPSIMPANLLKGAQADAVSQYVADNAGK